MNSGWGTDLATAIQELELWFKGVQSQLDAQAVFNGETLISRLKESAQSSGLNVKNRDAWREARNNPSEGF